MSKPAIQNWHELLPANCPPSDALQPNNAKFYRFVSHPPQPEDFLSQRQSQPHKTFAGIDECLVRSISLMSSKAGCEKLRKLSKFKSKTVAEIYLTPDSGVIKQTFQKPEHYSWWRKADFDPIAAACILDT